MLGLASSPSFLSIYSRLLDAFSTSLLLVFDRSRFLFFWICLTGRLRLWILVATALASVLPPLSSPSRCFDSSFLVCFVGSSSVDWSTCRALFCPRSVARSGRCENLWSFFPSLNLLVRFFSFSWFSQLHLPRWISSGGTLVGAIDLGLPSFLRKSLDCSFHLYMPDRAFLVCYSSAKSEGTDVLGRSFSSSYMSCRSFPFDSLRRLFRPYLMTTVILYRYLPLLYLIPLDSVVKTPLPDPLRSLHIIETTLRKPRKGLR